MLKRREPRAVTPRSLLQGSLMALGVAFGLLVVQVGLTVAAEGLFSGPEAETWGAAVGEVVLGVAMLVVLAQRGWLGLAAVTTRWRPSGISGSTAIIVTCLVPVVGVFSTSWQPTEKILALGVDYLATGFYEELAFRGLIFVFLALAWQQQPRSLMWAAAVSGVIFAIVHFNPILLIAAPLFGLAFTRLQLDARTIWMSMFLHASFDWLTEFPFDDSGETQDSLGQVAALFFLVVAGVGAFVALRSRTDSLPEAMDTAGPAAPPSS